MGRHEVLRGHDLVDSLIHAALETQVAVCHDAYEMALVVDHGDASDVILGHDGESVSDSLSAAYGDRVVNHAVLGTLHDSHLAGLLLD